MSQPQFEDKILICTDCEEEFVFTAGAQQYFRDRGIAEQPKRCKACYMALKKSKRKKHRTTGRHRSHNRPDAHGDYPASHY